MAEGCFLWLTVTVLHQTFSPDFTMMSFKAHLWLTSNSQESKEQSWKQIKCRSGLLSVLIYGGGVVCGEPQLSAAV